MRRPMVGLVLGSALALAAAPREFGSADATRLADTIRAGRAFEYTRHLTDSIGARLTGSDAYARAAAWAADELAADLGTDHVRREPLVLQRGWQRGRATARIVEPIEQDLHVAALGWTPGTPDGGVAGDVIAMQEGAASTIDAAAVKGRIVLITGSAPIAGGADARVERRREFDRALRDAGALAVLIAGSDSGNGLTARVRTFGSTIGAMPAAELGRADYDRLRSLMASGRVRVAFDASNRISDGSVNADNVIGELIGRERPEEWVIVGAHLDSWDFATGAQDNATGVAMVLEAARAMKALNLMPRRSVRFALWAGEEQGLLGSDAYVRTHRDELDGCVAVVNTDGGTGAMRGWTAPGREDVAQALRPFAQTLLARVGGATVDTSLQYVFDSDHTPFVLAGIPALDQNPDDSKYEEIHHKAGDTLDKVNRRNLDIGAAMVAITAYALADSPTRVAPRLLEEAVRRQLQRGQHD